jgi:hypothetical protein
MIAAPQEVRQRSDDPNLGSQWSRHRRLQVKTLPAARAARVSPSADCGALRGQPPLADENRFHRGRFVARRPRPYDRRAEGPTSMHAPKPSFDPAFDPSSRAPAARRLSLAAAALLALLGLLAACDDDDDDDPPALSAETIGPAGGALGLPDDSVVLIVPPGALTAEVAFRIDPGQIAIVPGYVDVGPAHAISPSSTGFLVPAQIVIPYAPDAVAASVDDGELRVGFRNSVGQVVGLVPLQVDAVAGRVTFETTALGTFWVASPDVVTANDLFPLNDGDTYRYDSGLVLTVSHTANEPNFAPQSIVRLTFLSLGSTTGIYFEANAMQLRQLGSFDIDHAQERFDSGVLWIDARDQVGVVRPVTDSYLGYRPYGVSAPSYTGIAEVTTRIGERGVVTTGRGSFDTVRVPVTTMFASTIPSWGEEQLELWLADGVGPVQIRLVAGYPPARLVEATVAGQPVSGF